MTRIDRHLGTAICLVATLVTVTRSAIAAGGAQSAGSRGTIKGRITLAGKLPGNPVIRMGKDPMCAAINRGKQVVQEAVIANLKGELANVFVSLQGDFVSTPAPNTPVTIDQRACIYLPRVVGVQVGQTLQVRNSDGLLHNVHSSSAVKENTFNIGQPLAGMVNQFRLKEEPGMLRLGCDVHSWMTAYIAVVNHPYYSVSDGAGVFQIVGVPPGSYTIHAWHERYGTMKRTVQVRAGSVAALDFAYTGQEAPPPEAPKLAR
jgi:plastocyanin